MAKVFISYSRASAGAVKALADDLGELGLEVWFDRDLTGGRA